MLAGTLLRFLLNLQCKNLELLCLTFAQRERESNREIDTIMAHAHPLRVLCSVNGG